MKQYLDKQQTAKLIELGFEKPKSLTGDYNITDNGDMESIEMKCAYSIGELIEILQKQVYQIEYSGIPCDLSTHYNGGTWLIGYICEGDGRFKTERLDLIDALYDMVVKLKAEGMI